MVKSYSDMLLVPFAKYLRKYGHIELSNLGASLLIPHDEYHFNSILFKPKRLSYSADKAWEFIASVVVLEKENLSEKDFPLYQRLKGLDCSLKTEGFLRKRFSMQSNDLLFHLKREIPDLLIDTHLCETINQDFILKDLLTKIKPDSLSITLFNQPIKAKDINEYCIQFKSQYECPSEIIWNINLEKFLGVIISKKKYTEIIDSIIQALEMISIHLLREVQLMKGRF